ncbi:hypothetical protein AALM99_05040 [Lactococcus muris]|uniref:Uncharacterized protein n=1 Tax=Lactococcus muris TaxID=2941330 RepID=A0ABV4DB76_9LACT
MMRDTIVFGETPPMTYNQATQHNTTQHNTTQHNTTHKQAVDSPSFSYAPKRSG